MVVVVVVDASFMVAETRIEDPVRDDDIIWKHVVGVIIDPLATAVARTHALVELDRRMVILSFLPAERELGRNISEPEAEDRRWGNVNLEQPATRRLNYLEFDSTAR